ncbi:hypothetical protein [uncultured Pseudoalteromonas sp.]|uniref:hypothetical protein n=1 Tax=uncultured Pseudoalteromonas sp. TaxID=114053 RepID=UPI000C43D9E4|nr:hypothetical protein [uncultured Pseudoalteromonas sp.]MBD56415.1 hypothetical protein [Pseudoalteromonas sp.]|tara:strand:+ start:1490 stop:3613 length:2124 start_codon:yes stop_codon:yes gene_type:complete
MKKGISLTVFIGLCAVGIYLYFDKQTQSETVTAKLPIHTNNVASLSSVTEDVNKQNTSKASALKKLRLAKLECEQQSIKATQAATDHSQIDAALKQALKDGLPLSEILSYSELTKISYRSFESLLINAIKSNAEEQFQYADSISILKNWQGLEVVDYFDADTVKKLTSNAESLNMNTRSIMFDVPLPEQVNKTALYKLLDNTDNFNTYLKSPFQLGPSALISPSILFILNAHSLTETEFENAISTKDFTINDIAIAIKSNLPNTYIAALIAQTAQLSGVPTAMSDNFIHEQLYLNLADVAVSEFNVPILELLNERGIEPTNLPDVFTAMDIALVNLKGSSNSQVQPIENKHRETLKYLKDKGYKAHGEHVRGTSEDRLLMFKSSLLPNSLLFVGEQFAAKAFDELNDIPLIANKAAFKHQSKDDSAISDALRAYEKQKQQFKPADETCQQVEQDLSNLEAIKTRSQAMDEIKQLEARQGPLTADMLQEIDPMLVHYWHLMHFRDLRQQTPYQPDAFKEAINNNDFNALATITQGAKLSTHQTNLLLAKTLENIEQMNAIWQSRANPTPPSALYLLKNLPLSDWQSLAENGFDFSLTDTFDMDMYFYATDHSNKAIEFLIKLGVPHDFSKPGLDILDQALEQSYNTQTLVDYMPNALKLVNHFEQNHFSRVQRLKELAPSVYEALIQLEPKLTPAEGTLMNNYQYSAL